jgi:hypothetical protein
MQSDLPPPQPPTNALRKIARTDTNNRSAMLILLVVFSHR